MILVIDIGNTNMEFGVFEGNILKTNFRLSVNKDITSDEVGILTSQFFNIHKIEISSIKDIVIASVVPQINYSITNAIKKYFKKDPLYIQENLKIDIVNMYDNAKEVGTDRLVNSYAAYSKYKRSLIVVDFGTATTFDIVGTQGEYVGGVIYPGIKISIEALFQKAAKLPRVEISTPSSVIGKNTVDSIRSGIIYGYVGAVKNIVENIKVEQKTEMLVVATGGLSAIINKHYKFDYLDKSLTLKGLNMIYNDFYKKQI